MNQSCPYNTFCFGSASDNCNHTAMQYCPDCNYPAFVAVICLAALLGVVIISSNLLALVVFIKRYRKGYDMKMDAIKLSLAFADLITGIQMFSSYIPNVVRTLRSTIFENRLYLNSESPIFCGGITLVAFTASIYHLLLLGAQRIYAVKWPLKYRNSSMKPVYGLIAMVWTIALLIASTPGFTSELKYGEVHYVCFLFSTPDVTISLIITMSFALIIPFIAMIIITITTTVMVYRQLHGGYQSDKNSINVSTEQHKRRLKMQASIIKTVAIMQLGFTLTVGPGVGCLLVYLTGSLPCQQYEKLLMACFLIYFTNSLVNVLVYSVREKKFRASILETFGKTTSLSRVSNVMEDDNRPFTMQATNNTLINQNRK